MTVTTNSSGLVYYCRKSGDNQLQPIAAVCTRNGNWSADPNELECLVYLQSYITTTSRIASDISLSTIASGGRLIVIILCIAIIFKFMQGENQMRKF